MFRRILKSIFWWCIIFSCTLQNVQAGDLQGIYANKGWNFRIALPQGWHYIEREQIIEKLKGVGQDSRELVERSDIITNISEHPFASAVEFNPNVNISAKNVVVTPHPATESQSVEYAKKLLLSLDPRGIISNVQQGKVDDLISVSAEYEYQLQSSKGIVDLFNFSTILVSKATHNYFILTATCKKEDKEKYSPIFKTVIDSFKERSDDE